MKDAVGTRGLILNEPFLWERGGKGRTGYSLPRRDVASAPLPDHLAGDGPDFPDLSEVEVVRHYTRLSTWNYGVDSGMYPLGSCTMKYNPKTNERQASLTGFSGAHPLVPSELCQGALQLIYELEHSPGARRRAGCRLGPAVGRRPGGIGRHVDFFCLSPGPG